MKIHHEMRRDSERPLSLAIGFFDGMHAGHEEIARSTRRMRKPGWRSECFVPPFDERIATLSPQAFMDALIRDLHVGAVSVGATFGFGHKRAGDVSHMASYLAERGVRFEPVENVVADGARISSTRIRELIGKGDMEAADRLLGHPYELRGIVEVGFGRGHDLGFPTANIVVAPDKMLPPDGVYSIIGRHDGRDHRGLVSIGTNPTFDGTARTVEAWLLDFNGGLYGEELALRDFRFVREQKRFGSVDELLAQMRLDATSVSLSSQS